MSWASFKAWLVKQFRVNKDLTEKELYKETKSNRVMQYISLATFLVFILFLAVIPTSLDIYKRMTFVGICLAGAGFNFAIYVNFRVNEAEASFELRLREAIKDAQDWVA
jgi:hypothetical protein